jgi:hypothetical protein
MFVCTNHLPRTIERVAGESKRQSAVVAAVALVGSCMFEPYGTAQCDQQARWHVWKNEPVSWYEP